MPAKTTSSPSKKTTAKPAAKGRANRAGRAGARDQSKRLPPVAVRLALAAAALKCALRQVEKRSKGIAATLEPGSHRVRLVVGVDGDVVVEASKAGRDAPMLSPRDLVRYLTRGTAPEAIESNVRAAIGWMRSLADDPGRDDTIDAIDAQIDAAIEKVCTDELYREKKPGSKGAVKGEPELSLLIDGVALRLPKAGEAAAAKGDDAE